MKFLRARARASNSILRPLTLKRSSVCHFKASINQHDDSTTAHGFIIPFVFLEFLNLQFLSHLKLILYKKGLATKEKSRVGLTRAFPGKSFYAFNLIYMARIKIPKVSGIA